MCAPNRWRTPSRRPTCTPRPAETAGWSGSSPRSTTTSGCGPGGTWPRSPRSGSACRTTRGSTSGRPQHRPPAAPPSGQGRDRAGDGRRPHMKDRDAEVVVAGGALLHDVGMSIHRVDHEAYSLFLVADRLDGLLADGYDEPERTVVMAEIMHAIIGHRRRGEPYTLEAGRRAGRRCPRHGSGTLADSDRGGPVRDPRPPPRRPSRRSGSRPATSAPSRSRSR